MTNENTTNETTEVSEPEVKNPAALLAKNKELLAKLKTLQTELEAAQTALEAAKTDATAWRTKWHEKAVIEPFDASLEDAAAGPSKYLRAELLERGLLKMEPDDEGIERPTWFDSKGKKIEVTDTWKHLADLNDKAISRMLRASGIAGGGAIASSAQATPNKAPEPAKPAAPSFGLR